MRDYLINCIIEEKDIITELLYIDNRIQYTFDNYVELIGKINDVLDESLDDNLYNAVTDGEFESVLRVLINVPNLDTLYVDKRYLGINKYLVSRANKYYGEEKIKLDTTNEFGKYNNSKYPVVLCGFDSFVEEMSKSLSGVDKILL